MFNDIALTERPAHVPAERVIDFDICNTDVRACQADLDQYFAAFRCLLAPLTS
jgi:hypothetical protein